MGTNNEDVLHATEVIYETLSVDDVSMDTMPIIVVRLIAALETYKDAKLTGAEKKEVVVQLALRLFQDNDVAGEWNPVVLAAIPNLVDVLISVDKGQVRFKGSKMASLFCCIPRVQVERKKKKKKKKSD